MAAFHSMFRQLYGPMILFSGGLVCQDCSPPSALQELTPWTLILILILLALEPLVL